MNIALLRLVRGEDKYNLLLLNQDSQLAGQDSNWYFVIQSQITTRYNVKPSFCVKRVKILERVYIFRSNVFVIMST